MAVPVSNVQPILDALISLADAFNGHDLDRIMNHFADDAVLEMPRGKDPWGTRFVGKAAVREGLAGRFKGMPDVHYGDESHFVAGGKKIRANGCDIYTFRAGLLFRQLSIYQHIHMMPVVRQKRLAPASFCFSP
jgi:ketosteroid isomerase-like protein